MSSVACNNILFHLRELPRHLHESRQKFFDEWFVETKKVEGVHSSDGGFFDVSLDDIYNFVEHLKSF